MYECQTTVSLRMATVGTLRYVYIHDDSFFVLRVVGSQVLNRTTGTLLTPTIIHFTITKLEVTHFHLWSVKLIGSSLVADVRTSTVLVVLYQFHQGSWCPLLWRQVKPEGCIVTRYRIWHSGVEVGIKVWGEGLNSSRGMETAGRG